MLTGWDVWKQLWGRWGRWSRWGSWGLQDFWKFSLRGWAPFPGFGSSEAQPLVKSSYEAQQHTVYFFMFSTDHRGWAFWEGCSATWPQHCGCGLCTLWQCNSGGPFYGARSGSLHAGSSKCWIHTWHLFMGTRGASVFEFLFPRIISWSIWILVFGVGELYYEKYEGLHVMFCINKFILKDTQNHKIAHIQQSSVLSWMFTSR